MDKTKLNAAFKALRKAGYFARQNFWCCQSCGWSAVPHEYENKAVFYHNQDNIDRLNNEPFNLAWAGDGNEICEILRGAGLTIEWDGSENTRIKVLTY